MAESSLKVSVIGHVIVDIVLQDNTYSNTKLSVLENLCTDVIIGQDFICQHKNLNVEFGGNKPTLSICG